jgi:hypothetical protein
MVNPGLHGAVDPPHDIYSCIYFFHVTQVAANVFSSWLTSMAQIVGVRIMETFSRR